jgi:serine/threonine-protein kinase
VAGKYRIDRVLGEGGMGVVVAATHQQLEQPVALKFLLPALAAQASLVHRFLREARAAVKIRSEHVARVLDVGEHQGAPFLVMELLEGSDIERVLATRGPLPPEEAVGYVLEASEAVAEAHALGIVHRDLKPANLFLAHRPSGAPIVKVLDFGISKAPARADDVKLTAATAIMGSPSYMSPEQLLSATEVDGRSDIWSLGVVLFELIAGHVPFVADSMPELVGAILQRAAPPVAARRPGIPAGLGEVIARCLQKDPAARYASVVELARALRPFGPARGALSVERIEAVLGQRSSAPRTGPDAPLAGPGDGATFSPSTSHRSYVERRLALPALILGVLAVGAAVALLGVRVRSPARVDAPAAFGLPSATQSAAAPSVALGSATLEPREGSLSPEPEGSAESPASATSSAAPSSSPPRIAPHLPAGPAPSTSHAAPSCRTVAHFDAQGNKHFKLECP